LRREGLCTSLVSEWRKQRDKGALGALGALGAAARRGRPPADPIKRESQRLRAESQRLRAQLARQAKVVEVQGEPSALLSRLAASGAERESSEPTPAGPSGPVPVVTN
jgi:transposase